MKGLLTASETSQVTTTTQESFTAEQVKHPQTIGDRQSLLRQQLCEAVARQLEKEVEELKKDVSMESTTQSDYTTDGKSLA